MIEALIKLIIKKIIQGLLIFFAALPFAQAKDSASECGKDEIYLSAIEACVIPSDDEEVQAKFEANSFLLDYFAKHPQEVKDETSK